MKGMFRLRAIVNGRRTGPESGVWMVRKVIPKDLREHFGGRQQFTASTGSADFRVAKIEAERLFSAWTAEIVAARAVGPGPIATEAGVLAAIENWRRVRCATAHNTPGKPVQAEPQVGPVEVREVELVGAEPRRRVTLRGPLPGDVQRRNDPLPIAREPDGALGAGPLAFARGYFEHPRNVGKSDKPEMPVDVYMLLDRLQRAAEAPSAWVHVQGFEPAMDAALEFGGLIGAVTTTVRDRTRQPFARAWLEVAQHEELARGQAATLLAANNVLELRLPTIDGTSAFQPRPGDRTVGEVIASFKKTLRPEDERKYEHIYKALEELLGASKLARAVTPEDVLDIRAFLRRIPTHVSKRKIFHGLTLMQAVDKADQIEDSGPDIAAPRLAPDTVRSYMTNLGIVFRHALKTMKCIDTNPVSGLVPDKCPSVDRRAFATAEQETLFVGLEARRKEDSAHYWVPAILAMTGARAGEICQLLTEDVKAAGEIDYIDLSPFDAEGRRVDKRLKNKWSIRVVPIHAELKRAGFLEFVARRRAAGAERLFPELKQDDTGSWSHEVSRQFGRHCDRIGLSDVSLTMHGLRHGFRNHGRAAGLATEIIDALGGWAAKSVGERYGDSRSVAVVAALAQHMARLDFGGFKFPGGAEDGPKT